MMKRTRAPHPTPPQQDPNGGEGGPRIAGNRRVRVAAGVARSFRPPDLEKFNARGRLSRRAPRRRFVVIER
jgi:hypothetical protein